MPHRSRTAVQSILNTQDKSKVLFSCTRVFLACTNAKLEIWSTVCNLWARLHMRLRLHLHACLGARVS